MKSRITIHAAFGSNCPDSLTAEEYLQEVVDEFDDIRYEGTPWRRTLDDECVVQFSIVTSDCVESRDDAERIITQIHNSAVGRMDYNTMEFVDCEPISKDNIPE